jgi:hypothetical protein
MISLARLLYAAPAGPDEPVELDLAGERDERADCV